LKPSKGLIQVIFKTKRNLKILFSLSQVVWKEFGINIQKLLISLNTSKCGGMKTVIVIWRVSGRPRGSRTRNISSIQLRG